MIHTMLLPSRWRSRIVPGYVIYEVVGATAGCTRKGTPILRITWRQTFGSQETFHTCAVVGGAAYAQLIESLGVVVTSPGALALALVGRLIQFTKPDRQRPHEPTITRAHGPEHMAAQILWRDAGKHGAPTCRGGWATCAMVFDKSLWLCPFETLESWRARRAEQAVRVGLVGEVVPATPAVPKVGEWWSLKGEIEASRVMEISGDGVILAEEPDSRRGLRGTISLADLHAWWSPCRPPEPKSSIGPQPDRYARREVRVDNGWDEFD